MQESVLPKLSDPTIAVFVVWTPSYTTDNNSDWVKKGMAIFKDKRVKQYWDEGQLVAGTEGYGKILDLPRDAPLAYDVYLWFGRQAEWKDKPPMPLGVLHQIADDGRWFEAEKLVEIVKKLK